MIRFGRHLGLGLLLVSLAGCAGIVVAGVPVNFVTTEVLPWTVNGKGLAEDGADMVTGKDCRLIAGLTRKDRDICEKRGSPATKKDFKGVIGTMQQRRGDKVAKTEIPPQTDVGGP